MTTNLKINYIELPAADFESIETFYETVFGWQFTSYGPQYHAFNDGAMEGGFYKSDQHSSTDNGAALVVLYADDLEAARDKVLAAGGKLCKEIFSFPGGRRFQFTDPNGNELAVWTHT